MYKLIAIDLDGTLLNSHGEITENTKNILKKCSEKGVEIVLASGRPVDSIKVILEEIGCGRYFIAGNGAVIYDIQKEKVIYENFLNKEKVLEIIKICEENSITYNVYEDKTILTTNLKYNVLYYHKENLKKEEEKQTHINIVENMYNYIKNMEEGKFLKITICDENIKIFNSILKKIKKIEKVDILEVSHMSRKIIKQGTEEVPIEYFYTEISAMNVNKWSAIEFLMKKLEVERKQVIAIGDNMNDKEMIENAGLGIAMEGSTPQITEIADYITNSNNDDGVGKALEKYIL